MQLLIEDTLLPMTDLANKESTDAFGPSLTCSGQYKINVTDTTATDEGL